MVRFLMVQVRDFNSLIYHTMIFCLLVRLIPYKILITSYECERNISSVAFFQYDKNKPQRLVLLENDPETNKTEEWCIYESYSDILVAPKCDKPLPGLDFGSEVVFHEFTA